MPCRQQALSWLSIRACPNSVVAIEPNVEVRAAANSSRCVPTQHAISLNLQSPITLQQ